MCMATLSRAARRLRGGCVPRSRASPLYKKWPTRAAPVDAHGARLREAADAADGLRLVGGRLLERMRARLRARLRARVHACVRACACVRVRTDVLAGKWAVGHAYVPVRSRSWTRTGLRTCMRACACVRM